MGFFFFFEYRSIDIVPRKLDYVHLNVKVGKSTVTSPHILCLREHISFFLSFFLSFFFFFGLFVFLGLLSGHMEVPRLGFQPELQLPQCRIQVTSATYTTAHGNAGSLNH